MARRTVAPVVMFEELVLSWTTSKLASFIVAGLDFVRAYESPEIGGQARLEIVLAANAKLSPIVFSHREEPRVVFETAIRRLSESAPDLLSRAAAEILRRPSKELSAERLTDLLALLASIEFVQGEFVALSALERFLQERAWHYAADDFGEAAVYLGAQGIGGMPALVIAQRLMRHGLLRQPGVEAALQMVASTSPRLLALGFEMLREATEASVDFESLQAVLCEIVDRSAPLALLGALAQLNPADNAALFRASFAGANAPFELIRLIDDIGSEARLSARHQSAAFDLEHLRPGAAGPGGQMFWHRSVMRVAQVTPRIVSTEHLGVTAPHDFFDVWRAPAVRFAEEIVPRASKMLALLQPGRLN